jgi:hypothetical protein
MKKFAFFLSVFFLFPLGTHAACDISKQNVQALAQKDLDAVYSYNDFGLKKPLLIVSDSDVTEYYGEELHGVITIFPKSLQILRCDDNVDQLTPMVAEIVSHEYTHNLDEKLGLSKKIGISKMSEDTANMGEHVFNNLIWHTGYATGNVSVMGLDKYGKLLGIING